MQKVLDFIARSWGKMTRFQPVSEGTLIGLPHPYTVSGSDGGNGKFHYLETYFISRGLALQGHAELVRDNCENLLYLVNEYGFVPAANCTTCLDLSQPPFLGAMIELTARVCPECLILKNGRMAARGETAVLLQQHDLLEECGLE